MAEADMLISHDDAAILVTPAAYADARIHDVYRRLRAEKPVARAEVPGYDPFWVITKHADIEYVGKNNALFHYGDRFSVLTDRRGVEAIESMTGRPYIIRALTSMDPPDHMKYRLLTQSWFMPSNLRKIEDRIRATARESVEKMAALGGRCDFVSEIALHYPLKVVMEILGVPAEDYPMMLQLTQQIFAPNDPELAGSAEAADASFGEMLVQTTAAMTAYFEKLADARRKEPKEDLATLLANGEVNGHPLDAMDLMGYFVIVATAGHDTTSSSTGAAMRALASDPELFARVKADPASLAGLIEESIRWETPVKHFMRSAVNDVELRGQTIKANDWIMICYASANRDEDIFDDPYSFKIDRKPGKNMAFGIGPHVCLGQHLAKLEMRILLEELLPRLESVELDGTPTMIESTFVNGPKSIPLKYVMR